MSEQKPDVLTRNEIEQAFDEVFPRHDLHQESIDFARVVERAVLAKLAQWACQTLKIGEYTIRRHDEQRVSIHTENGEGGTFSAKELSDAIGAFYGDNF